MNIFEFLSYEATPTEKYLGIATVRAWGKIILKFKIVPGKDGRGFFAAVAAYKNGVKPDGKDKYDDAFTIDSNYEAGELKKLIEDNVSPYASNSNATAQNSVYSEQGIHAIASGKQTPMYGQQNANFSNAATGNFPQPRNVGVHTASNDEVPF